MTGCLADTCKTVVAKESRGEERRVCKVQMWMHFMSPVGRKKTTIDMFRYKIIQGRVA